MPSPVKKYKNQVEENEASRHARNEKQRDAQIGAQEQARSGALIAEVEPDSLAQQLGIVPGARLLELNGEPLRDAIQLRSADGDGRLSLLVLQPDGRATFHDVRKDPFEPLGLHADAELFDGVRRCENKCPFCFVDQLPKRVKGQKNLRRTLYVRDDDYRLSFLHGHYITLTNLKDDDYARIIEEKLSPLCVSVHATDPIVRQRMVGSSRDGGDILGRLRYLIANNICINAQIVLCPGWNDGLHLTKSVRDLMQLHPHVESVAVVPVGLTQFMPPERGMRTVQPEEARAILRQLEPLQRQARQEFGTNFVYASDEMYLLAGETMPRASYYDGFPQYANGVGTIRAFQDETARLPKWKRAKTFQTPPRITLVTGQLAAPAMRELAQTLDLCDLARAQVVAVENTFWGGNVGCAGLIMGEEVRAQLQNRDLGECVFLPSDAVDKERRMLDDVTLDELSREFGVPFRADATGPKSLARLLKKS